MKNTIFMKRLIYLLSIFLPFAASSQNMYNIADLFENAPSGTARFISMGGSMGALGADLSVMGTNPAGTAIYRSCDFNLTGVFDVVKNMSKYQGEAVPASFNSADLSNLGFVIAYETESSPVKFVNFGGNFRRRMNVRSNFDMKGIADGFSQQYVIDYLYNQNPFDVNDMNAGMYSGFNYNWLSLLAADAGIFDSEGNFLLNKDGLIYLPDELGYSCEQRGNQDVFDMNISTNIWDMVYIGATVGFYKLDYSRYSNYYEKDQHGDIYILNNNYNVRGSGYDLKLGAIVRPFRYSSFKIGAYLHSPVFYRLTDRSSATIEGPFGKSFETSSSDCYGDDLYTEYRLNTPWRYGAALSYTFGKRVALNAEYEYSDISSAGFTGRDDIDKVQNVEISENMQSQHTVRVGAEVSFDKIALRAGYNYITSPFKAGAYKCLDNATIADTSTEYMNRFDKNVFTFGLGYTSKIVYFDVAYMCQRQNAEFYPFYDMDYENPGATVTTVSHSIVAGVGVRF